MCQCIIVPDVGTDSSLPSRFSAAHELFIPSVAGTEECKLHVRTAEQVVQSIGNKVKAFLFGHARDHCYKGNIIPDFETKLLLKSFFADGFACAVFQRVIRCDDPVVLRIEHHIVDPVYDPGKLFGAGIQDAVQPFPVIRSADLISITRRYRVYPVCKNAAGFHEIGTAV